MFSLVALGVLLRKALFTPRLPKICLCSLLVVCFNFIYFGCAGFSLLHGLFSSFGQQELLFSCSAWASIVAAQGLCSFGSQALEHRLNNCA